MIGHTVWNLFLAFLPIALAWPLARRLRTPGGLRPSISTLALAVAWVLLLPNAPYLVTEVRHFLFDSPWREMIASASEDATALRWAAAWGAFFLAYGIVGLVAFTAGLRPIESALRAHGVPIRLFRLGFYPLMSLGVWLGLIPRFNSWDAFVRPVEVVGSAVWALTHPPTVAMILGFAFVLAGAHAVLDAAWRGRRPGPSTAPVSAAATAG